MYFVLVYYYNNYKKFWAIILLRANWFSTIDFVTAMPMAKPMGFRKNRVQTVVDQFWNRESSSSSLQMFAHFMYHFDMLYGIII